MFIQITKHKSARQSELIGVFDLDTSTVSGVTKSFLSRAEKEGRTVGINILPKSFVLTGQKDDFRIYFSSNMTSHIKKHRLSTD